MSSSRGQKRKQDQTEKPPTPVNVTVNIMSGAVDVVTSSKDAKVIIEEVKK